MIDLKIASIFLLFVVHLIVELAKWSRIINILTKMKLCKEFVFMHIFIENIEYFMYKFNIFCVSSCDEMDTSKCLKSSSLKK